MRMAGSLSGSPRSRRLQHRRRQTEMWPASCHLPMA